MSAGGEGLESGGVAGGKSSSVSAREVLVNASQHANARNVSVRLDEIGADLRLVITDDGRGFSPSELSQRLAEGHIGLAAQRMRVESAGGTFDVRSAPDWGTTVEIRLPVDSAAPG